VSESGKQADKVVHIQEARMNNEKRVSERSVVVRREESGAWSVALPHAERQDGVFITYATDESEALWLASQMQPELEVRVIH
jgi:hypothetical protein